MPTLTVADCRRFIRAVSDRAREMAVPVSIALAGPEGHLIALERMDGAGRITPETSWAKAFTMSAFRSMSARFQDGLVTRRWLRERNPQPAVNAAVCTGGKLFISGGAAPVFKGNTMVGAEGIPGGASDQDEAMGRFAREKRGWRHTPERDDTPQEVTDHIQAIHERVGLSQRKPSPRGGAARVALAPPPARR